MATTSVVRDQCSFFFYFLQCEAAGVWLLKVHFLDLHLHFTTLEMSATFTSNFLWLCNTWESCFKTYNFCDILHFLFRSRAFYTMPQQHLVCLNHTLHIQHLRFRKHFMPCSFLNHLNSQRVTVFVTGRHIPLFTIPLMTLAGEAVSSYRTYITSSTNYRHL